MDSFGDAAIIIICSIFFSIFTSSQSFWVTALLYAVFLHWNNKRLDKHRACLYSTYSFLFFHRFTGMPLSCINIDDHSGKTIIENHMLNTSVRYHSKDFYLYKQNDKNFIFPKFSTSYIYMINKDDIQKMEQKLKLHLYSPPALPPSYNGLQYNESSIYPELLYKHLLYQQYVGFLLLIIPLCSNFILYPVICLVAAFIWMLWLCIIEDRKQNLLTAFCQAYTDGDGTLFIDKALHFKESLPSKKQRDYISFYIILAHYYHNIPVTDTYIKDTLVIFPNSRPYQDTLVFHLLLELLPLWAEKDLQGIINSMNNYKKEIARLRYSKWPQIKIAENIAEILTSILKNDDTSALKYVNEIDSIKTKSKSYLHYPLTALINYLDLLSHINSSEKYTASLDYLCAHTGILPLISRIK